MRQGASAVHSSNPSLLIFLSGLSFDTFLTPIVRGTSLTPSSAKFSFNDFPNSANKLVLELHNYENSASSCASLRANL